MSKKIVFVALAVIIVLIVGWYLVSPAFITVEADEESPLIVRDAMVTMSDEEKAEFEEAVDEVADESTEMSDVMPQEALLLSQGMFKPSAHEVAGEALLIQDVDGKKILRFEDFDTINGPNLHIYLSSDLSEDDFIDLGEIKATKGNVNYEIPEGIDTDKYNNVLVWCVPFKVLFSYAELQ